MPLVKIKTLIVDDSILFRRTLETNLSADPYIEVIGTAVDAMDAMDKIEKLNPDVVTLDVEMPKMNGIEFLKKLMPVHPVPVVVVSSLPINALDALSAGAVDFVKKPSVQGAADLKNFVRELTIKVKIASTAKVGKRQPVVAPVVAARPTASAAAPSIMPLSISPRAASNNDIIIAIGASTGGTEAILEVVRNLPANTPGIVIVQHMPPVFTQMYAQRLDKLCKMRVKEAVNGDKVERGKIIIAAGEYQMTLQKDARGSYCIKSEPGARVNGHCPSVGVLFNSIIATAKSSKVVGVILTGMGADGSKEIASMRRAGAYTIGQDKESCVVYGMPMVAYDLGGITKQLPLNQISGEIIRYINTL